MEKVTPSTPPRTQIITDSQKGKFIHQPIITRPGRTKMMALIEPPTEATVWTVMFSQMVEPRNARSRAMEMTAAGMAEAKVRPTFSPR
ncbi:hypothetical protein D9M72_608680 [compost metagenome]